MTCIIQGFKTKKALREHVLQGNVDVQIHDPSIFNERWFTIRDLQPGEEIVATNHPKRSWFAQVGRYTNGVYYIK